MKTETEIRNDIERILTKAKCEKKRKPNVDKYLEFIKIVNTLSPQKVMEERDKILSRIHKAEAMFPEYLDNFTAFRLKNQESHEKEVRKVFNKEMKFSDLKRRLKNLNYILDI